MGLLSLFLPEIVVLSTAVVLLALEIAFPKGKNSYFPWIAVVGCLGAIGSTALLLGRQPSLFDASFTVDGLTYFTRIAIAVTSLIVVVASSGSQTSRRGQGEYYCLLFLSILGAMVMAASTGLIGLFLGLELTAMPVYALMLFNKDDHKAGEATMKYFVISMLASVLILYGVSFVYGITGTINLYEIAGRLSTARVPAALLSLSVLFLTVGFCFKIGAVPFHFWAPDAFEGAPSVIAAYLSAIPKFAVFTALIRIFNIALLSDRPDWALSFAVLSAVTMTVGNLLALQQPNIKRLLGYASVSSAGFVLMGLAVGTKEALSASLLYQFVAATATIGAFLIVQASSKKFVAENIEDYAGYSRRSPLLAAYMTLFLLSLTGIPPLAGFWGTLFLLQAVIQEHPWLAIAGVINSGISLFYCLRILGVMYSAEGGSGIEIDKRVPVLLAITGSALLAGLIIPLVPFLVDLARAAVSWLSI